MQKNRLYHQGAHDIWRRQIKTEPGAGETAQQLRAAAILAEDLSWVSSIHVEQLTLPVTPVPGDAMPPVSARTYSHFYKSIHRQ